MGAMAYLDKAKEVAADLARKGWAAAAIAGHLNGAFPLDFVVAGQRIVARWGRAYACRVNVL